MSKILKIPFLAFPHSGWIILVLITTSSIGLSTLFYPYELAPLLIGGAILFVAILLMCLKDISLFFCITLFIVFLPNGLLSASIQSILNRLLTIATFGIWLFDAINHRRRIILTSTLVFMIAFLLWSAITLFWAQTIDIALTRLQAYFLRFLLYLFLLPHMINSEKDLRRLMKTLAFSGWTLVFVSIFALITTGYSAGSRLAVLNANANGLGIYLLIDFVAILWLAINAFNQYKTIITPANLYLIILIAITALSGSRGSALSLVVTLLMFLFWRPTRRWGGLGLFIITIGLITAPFVFKTTIERFTITSGDTLLGGREALWRAAWNIIQLQPWTGVGIGNSPYAVIPFVKILRDIQDATFTYIHNPILVIWAETGVPGLILYLSVLGSAAWLFIKSYFLSRNQVSKVRLGYFPLVVSLFIGYMLSWIKGGGMESDHTYFLVLSFLLIPHSMESNK